MPFFGFLITAAFAPTWSGAADAPRWIVLAVALPLIYLCSQYRSVQFTLPTMLGGVWLLWAVVTATWSPLPADGLGAVAQLVILAGAYWFGACYEDLDHLYRGMIYGLVPSLLLVPFQLYGWSPVLQVASPAGLFINKNFLAETALPLLILAVARGWPGMAAVASVCVLAPLSRAVLLAGACVASLAVPRRYWYVGAVCIPAVVWIIFIASVGHLESLDQRLDIWANTVSGITFAGHGAGSFRTLYPLYASMGDVLTSRPEHAHNDFLEMAFEHGVVGLGLFGCFLASVFCTGAKDTRLALLALCVVACFAFPLHNPATAFLAACLCGNLAGNWEPLRGGIRPRRAGVLYPGWRTAGVRR